MLITLLPDKRNNNKFSIHNQWVHLTAGILGKDELSFSKATAWPTGWIYMGMGTVQHFPAFIILYSFALQISYL
jgi:hypothetical protein